MPTSVLEQGSQIRLPLYLLQQKDRNGEKHQSRVPQTTKEPINLTGAMAPRNLHLPSNFGVGISSSYITCLLF